MLFWDSMDLLTLWKLRVSHHCMFIVWKERKWRILKADGSYVDRVKQPLLSKQLLKSQKHLSASSRECDVSLAVITHDSSPRGHIPTGSRDCSWELSGLSPGWRSCALSCTCAPWPREPVGSTAAWETKSRSSLGIPSLSYHPSLLQPWQPFGEKERGLSCERMVKRL